MCIAMVCFPGCDAITYEISLIFLIKLLFYMTKKSRQGMKMKMRMKILRMNLENEKSF